MLTKSKSSKDIIELEKTSMCASSSTHKFGKVMLWPLGQATIIIKAWRTWVICSLLIVTVPHGLLLVTKVDERFLNETSLEIL